MNSLPPLDEFRSVGVEKPCVGFRVVASGGNERFRNPLGPRNPQTDATSLVPRDHLTWRMAPSPFVSLWMSWHRAVQWAEKRAERGATDIHIVAVWIHDQVVYDAHKAAMTFQLPLQFHKNEVIIVGHGVEHDYSVLAGFHWVTERQWETVTFVLDGMPLSIRLPIGSLEFEADSKLDEIEFEKSVRWQKGGFAALRFEVYSSTESHDDSKVDVLARLLCKKPFCAEEVVATSRDIASVELMDQLAKLDI